MSGKRPVEAKTCARRSIRQSLPSMAYLTLVPDPSISNAEIADRLASLAQLLSTQKENPYKVKAYQRAAA